jgi:hypothetical protein
MLFDDSPLRFLIQGFLYRFEETACDKSASGEMLGFVVTLTDALENS